jgi:hypothetical protein
MKPLIPAMLRRHIWCVTQADGTKRFLTIP